MCELIYFWPKKEQAYFHVIQNVICGVTENRQGKINRGMAVQCRPGRVNIATRILAGMIRPLPKEG